MKNVIKNIPAQYEMRQERGATLFVLSGDWIIQSLAPVVKEFATSHDVPPNDTVIISLEQVTRLDTAGALLINQSLAYFEESGKNCTLQVENPSYKTLLDTSTPVGPEETEKPLPYILGVLHNLGKFVCEIGVNVRTFPCNKPPKTLSAL